MLVFVLWMLFTVSPILDNVQGEYLQPSPFNHQLFLHGSRERYIRYFDPWMNTQSEDPNSDDRWTGVIYPAYNIFFNQKPPLETGFKLDKNKTVDGTIHMSIPIRKNGQIIVGLYKRVNDTSYTIGEQTTSANDLLNGYFDVEMEILREIVNSSDMFFFGLHLHFTEETVVTIYLDGSSEISLPISSIIPPDKENGSIDPIVDNNMRSAKSKELGIFHMSIIILMITAICATSVFLLRKYLSKNIEKQPRY